MKAVIQCGGKGTRFPIASGHLDLVIDPHLSVNRPVIERAIASSYS